MTTYLALFRGLNIGGHNKVAMKELAALLEEVGCSNVRTYIQSGNVIFGISNRSRSRLTQVIGQAMLERFGFAPRVMLLTAAELQDVIAHNPFPATDGKALHVLFLEENPVKPDLERLGAIRKDSEQFMLGDRVFYLYTPEGVGRSKLAASVERCLGVATTGRNWNTVNRLVSMFQEQEGNVTE
jgi:uncharacterized protein (DUF1697 family)